MNQYKMDPIQNTIKKILLIEDDPDIMETTKEILLIAGYEVIVAENGRRGIDLAREEKPDLILCDIMMPNLDGYGVLKIISKNPETAGVPFIFLTASSEKSDIRKGMNMGADDYITKPFEETDLLEAVEMRLRKSEALKKDFESSLEGLNEFISEARGLAELKSLPENRKMKTYRRKEVIYREDDYSNYIYFVSSGRVKCLKTDYSGKEILNDIHGSGEFIGYLTMLEGTEYHETAMAMEETEVAVIPRLDFLDLIRKNRDVAVKFIKMLSGNVQDKERRMLMLAYASVMERVAEALLILREKEKLQSGQEAKIKILREDLASLAGTSVETLIRTLTEFKNEKLISSDEDGICILNEKSLQKTARGY